MKYFYIGPTAVKFWNGKEYQTGIAYQDVIITSEKVENGYIPNALKINNLLDLGRAQGLSEDNIIIELEWELF